MIKMVKKKVETNNIAKPDINDLPNSIKRLFKEKVKGISDEEIAKQIRGK